MGKICLISDGKIFAFLQAEWKHFHYGPRYAFYCYAVSVVASLAFCLFIRRNGVPELPIMEDGATAWIWGLLTAIGIALFGLRRRWCKAALLLTATVVGLCCLRSAAEWLLRLPLVLELVSALVFLVLLRLMWRWVDTAFPVACKIFPREHDALGRGRMYAAVHARIRQQPEWCGAAIAVYGEWGCGKSHLLHYLGNRLEQPFRKEHYDDPEAEDENLYQGRYEICRVLLWQYHSSEEALSAIAHNLTRAVSSAKPFPTAGIVNLAVAMFCMLFGVGDENIREAIKGIVKQASAVDGQIEFINAYLRAQSRRAVLVIEDVERAAPEVIEHLLPLIERLKRITSLTILCALDPAELQHKCEHTRMVGPSLQGYLDKIFDMSFAIPPIPEDFVNEYFSSYVQERYPECPLLIAYAKKSPLRFRTPRQIERVAARLASMEWMYFRKPHQRSELTPLNREIVFHVEILRVLYQEAFAELNALDRPANVLYDYLSNHQENTHASAIPLCAALIRKDSMFKSLARAIAEDNRTYSVHTKAAMGEYYARRIGLSEEENAEVLRRWASSPHIPPSVMIKLYLGVDSIEKQESVVNSLTAYALGQILEAGPLSAQAALVLPSYIGSLERSNAPDETVSYWGYGRIVKAVSVQAMLALLLQRCKGDRRPECQCLYKLIADKISLFDMADLLKLLRMVQNGMNIKPETDALVKEICLYAESKILNDSLNELTANCCNHLLDYLTALSSLSLSMPDYFEEDKMLFYEDTMSASLQMLRTLRQRLALAAPSAQVSLFVGWVKSLRVRIFPSADGCGFCGVSRRSARFLLPLLRAAAASPSFAGELARALSSAEEPIIYCTIHCLEKICSSSKLTQGLLLQKGYPQGTKSIAAILKLFIDEPLSAQSQNLGTSHSTEKSVAMVNGR